MAKHINGENVLLIILLEQALLRQADYIVN